MPLVRLKFSSSPLWPHPKNVKQFKAPPNAWCPAKVSKAPPVNILCEYPADAYDTNNLDELRNILGLKIKKNKDNSKSFEIPVVKNLFASPTKAIEVAKFAESISRNETFRASLRTNMFDSYEKNIDLILTSIENDLEKHIKNMQAAYDIKREHEILTSRIKHKKNIDRETDMDIDDAEIDNSASIKSLSKRLDKHQSIYYSSVFWNGKANGEKIAHSIDTRINICVSEIKSLRETYQDLWSRMKLSPGMPPHLHHDDVETRRFVVMRVLNREIAEAMKMFSNNK